MRKIRIIIIFLFVAYSVSVSSQIIVDNLNFDTLRINKDTLLIKLSGERKLYSLTPIKNGKKHGRSIIFQIGGYYAAYFNYQNDILDGYFGMIDAFGISSYGHYKNGLRHGYFCDKGEQSIEEGEYRKGLKIGKWFYCKDGNEKIIKYKNRGLRRDTLILLDSSLKENLRAYEKKKTKLLSQIRKNRIPLDEDIALTYWGMADIYGDEVVRRKQTGLILQSSYLDKWIKLLYYTDRKIKETLLYIQFNTIQ